MTPRERYLRDGIVFPLVALEPGEVETYRGHVEAHVAAEPEEVRWLHLRHDWARALATRPAVVARAEELLGEPVVVWGTLLLRKAPRSDGYVAWHQDGAYTNFSGDDSLSAWIALGDSTAEAGCMRVLAGTHRQRLPHRQIDDARNLLRAGQSVDATVDESEAIDVTLKAGQMSLHHFDLIHGSGPNRSAAARTGFIVRYLKASVDWREWPVIPTR
ncbi:MAG TPA: phytanoyl-CoA dioxygenase family protein [Thermoanaerobaculia bacterium]|jgi:ectoine hydroxylase-related dioxygenase (phytanoyl-CoA dioxygenase family)